MATEQTETRPRSRHRSPSYPGIGLADAIERARVLYTEDRMNAAPIDVAYGHWGYKSRSSVGSITIAALKKFGLLDDEGSGAQRMVRLTEPARRIVLGSEDRAELIRVAALSPTIHAELWERHSDGLPSRDNLRRYLIIERGFNERAVDDFIDQFLATLEFAGLLPGDTMSASTTDTPPSEDAVTSPPTTSAPPLTPELEQQLATVPVGIGVRVFALPISRKQQALLHVPANLDERGWEQMIAVLNAMKPGILSNDDEEAVEDATDE
jgi:hypothetical protein